MAKFINHDHTHAHLCFMFVRHIPYQFHTLLLYFMPDFYDAPMITISTPDGSTVESMLWLQLPGAYELLSKKKCPTCVPILC